MSKGAKAIGRPMLGAVLPLMIGMRRMSVKLRDSLPGPRPALREKFSESLFIEREGRPYKLSLGRLEEIEEALRRGDSVDDGLRQELLGLIAHVAKGMGASKGRPTNSTRRRAAIACMLVETHGVSPKDAFFAVTPNDLKDDALRKDRLTLERTYRTLQKSGERFIVLESWVNAALARLKSSSNRK